MCRHCLNCFSLQHNGINLPSDCIFRLCYNDNILYTVFVFYFKQKSIVVANFEYFGSNTKILLKLLSSVYLPFVLLHFVYLDIALNTFCTARF